MKRQGITHASLFSLVACLLCACKSTATNEIYTELASRQRIALQCTKYKLPNDEERKKIIEEIDEMFAARPGALGSDPEVQRIVSRALKSPLPTPYEDPLTYWIVVRRTTELMKPARRLGLKQAPPFATVPLPMINAETIPVGEGYGVLVSSRLLMFAQEMVKVLAQTLPYTEKDTLAFDFSEEGAKAAIAQNPAIKERFVADLLAFHGYLPFLEPWIQDPTYDPIVTGLRDGIELFVFGHEFGHAIEKHSNAAIQLLVLPADAGLCAGNNDSVRHSINVIRRSWHNEARADILGMSLSAEAAGSEANPYIRGLRRIGPLMFFVLLDILDRSKAIVETGVDPGHPSEEEMLGMIALLEPAESTSEEDGELDTSPPSDHKLHPPAVLRYTYLKPLVEESVSAPTLSQYERDAAMLGNILLRNTVLLWKESVPALERAHTLRDEMQKIMNGESTDAEGKAR